jgi:hypothetical protein
MALIFPKWTNEIPRVAAPVLTLLSGVVVFVVWFWFSPKHTDVGYAPVQPIPYSHALHAGRGMVKLTDGTMSSALGLDCRYCHNNVEKSASAGVPPTQTCMNCHKQVKLGSLLLAPLYKSWGDGKPENDGGGVPWKRIHKVADYAYFPHAAHVALKKEGAAIGCVSCHGRVDQMVVVAQQQPLSMSWCLDCHNNPAVFLRPIDQLTNMSWTTDPAWDAKAKDIATRLNPPGNKNAATVMPDGQVIVRATAGCSGCHR